MTSHLAPVTVIGLGPMGRAMAAALMRAGHRVTVWNRTPSRYVFYSGPKEVFDVHEPALRLIGEPKYLGGDPGLAQLFYQAHLDLFLTALSSLLHATALVTAAGVPAAEFLPGALATLTGIPAMIGDGLELARQLEAGEHPGDLSSALMMGATADHIVRTSEKAGVDLRLPQAVKSHYDQAITSGYGTKNWTALYEVIKAPRGHLP